MDTGVKVVGAPSPSDDSPTRDDERDPKGADRRAARSIPAGSKGVLGLKVTAALGLIGTLVFGLLWAGSSSPNAQDPAVISSARVFLNDLTNFNAKSIDHDFGAITSMATGTFSTQANQFFNSAIRVELEKALAESRGQIRNIYVQNESASQASVYAVVDQVYVNNKISTPQADVLRVVVNLRKVGSTWRISDVTTLEGATPGSGTSASGSAGSTVPGQ